MNLLDWLEKTREKSENKRRKIAMGLAFLIVAVVAIVWLTISFIPREEITGVSFENNAPFSLIKDAIDEIKQ